MFTPDDFIDDSPGRAFGYDSTEARFRRFEAAHVAKHGRHVDAREVWNEVMAHAPTPPTDEERALLGRAAASFGNRDDWSKFRHLLNRHGLL